MSCVSHVRGRICRPRTLRNEAPCCSGWSLPVFPYSPSCCCGDTDCIHLMVVSDRTYISSLIAVLYVITCMPLLLADAGDRP